MSGHSPAMGLLTLSAIEAEVKRLAFRIGANGYVLPTFGYSEDGGRPHIEVNWLYHYVAVERGKELSRISTLDLDELLYNVFSHVTFSLACDYELAHRVEHEDCRRQIFRKQLELFAVLSPDWEERQRAEHADTLKRYPFHDN